MSEPMKNWDICKKCCNYTDPDGADPELCYDCNYQENMSSICGEGKYYEQY